VWSTTRRGTQAWRARGLQRKEWKQKKCEIDVVQEGEDKTIENDGRGGFASGDLQLRTGGPPPWLPLPLALLFMGRLNEFDMVGISYVAIAAAVAAASTLKLCAIVRQKARCSSRCSSSRNHPQPRRFQSVFKTFSKTIRFSPFHPRQPLFFPPPRVRCVVCRAF